MINLRKWRGESEWFRFYLHESTCWNICIKNDYVCCLGCRISSKRKVVCAALRLYAYFHQAGLVFSSMDEKHSRDNVCFFFHAKHFETELLTWTYNLNPHKTITILLSKQSVNFYSDRVFFHHGITVSWKRKTISPKIQLVTTSHFSYILILTSWKILFLPYHP